jgi:hypothetical protein
MTIKNVIAIGKGLGLLIMVEDNSGVEVTFRSSLRIIVTAPKLASVNPVELMAIYPFEPTCDQTGNHTYKNVRVNAREGE